MAKARAQYVCQSCGTVHMRWSGKCDGCGEWNSLQEEVPQAASLPNSVTAGRKGRIVSMSSLASDEKDPDRILTKVGEFDRVLGGGIVPASAVLIGGDPGIGKSTLLLQVLCSLARNGRRVLYVSGEEAAAQIRLRARRLGLADAPVDLATETNLRDILSTLEHGQPPEVVVIDSIQTVFADTVESAPGTVSQLRACSAELVRFAKRKGSALFIVGHVTKDGQIAGPRVVEHLVDTVLYFEGDRGHRFRILRAVKNRFGGTDEIGVFDMTGEGLMEVPNPSELFLTDREEAVPGTAVFAGMEGTRPVLVEIQALVAPTQNANPRRTVVGWDSGRLAMVLAVLDARCGLGFGGADVYLNVAGGLKINEPAADLAVAAALLSSLFQAPIDGRTAVFGEIALSGEIRPVAMPDARVKESSKLGFETVWMPRASGSGKMDGLAHVADLVKRLGGNG